MSDFPDYEDESFPPLPPPVSPGGEGRDDGEPFTNGEEEEGGEVSRLAEVPAAKRKGVKRPQPKLDSNRLISERGLPALRTLFDDVTFKGKGHEVENLRLLMQKMQNWAHRLYPKMQFEDFIDKVEKLGSKKEVQTCLKRIRLDMPLTHDDFTGEEEVPPELLVSEDPFSREDFLQDLQDPISSTPAPPGPQRPPGPQSSPGFSGPPAGLSEEQLRRMELNRRLALERKLARQQQETDSQMLEVEPSSGSSGNVLDGSTDQEEKMEDLQPINDNTQQQTEEQQTEEQQTEEQQTEQQTQQQTEEQQTEEPEQQPEQLPNTDSEPPQTEEEPKPELQQDDDDDEDQ